MKKFGILTIMACLCPGMAFAATVDAGIVERIKKVGSVCVEGSDCARAETDTAAMATVNPTAATSSSSVEENYQKTCATCHAIGVLGAPKLGDTLAWEPRLAKGMDVLYQNSINGMPPAMPVKGLCLSCSDEDLKALVDYMVNLSE